MPVIVFVISKFSKAVMNDRMNDFMADYYNLSLVKAVFFEFD